MRPSGSRGTLRGLPSLALAAGLALALASCSDAPGPRAPRVVLIGIDGLDPVVANELLAAGRLPNLQRFVDRGVVGRIASMVPNYSPVIWTSIATGRGPSQHGIDDFVAPPLPGESEGLPYTSNCRKVPALWNIVSAAGLTVDTVGWWITWPAEPVNGRLVASYAAQAQAHVIWKPGLWNQLTEQTFPTSLATEIEPLITFVDEAEELRPMMRSAFDVPEHYSDMTGRLLTDLAWTLSGDRSFAAITEHFLDNDPGELVMAYLALPDVAGHRFWRYYRPEDFSAFYGVPEPERTDLADFLASAYVETDRLVGRMLDRIPDDATVVLLSDHGMHADPENLSKPDAITSGHHQTAPPGVFAALGPLVKHQGNLLADVKRGELGHVLGVAPLVLRVLELPVPESWPLVVQANPLERILDDTWRAEHRLLLGPDRDGEFRPATPPRVPGADLNGQFYDVLYDLGYMGERPGGERR